MIPTKEKPLYRRDVLIKFYKQTFPSVADFVHRRGGSLEDARDIFQEAMIAYYEKVLTNPNAEEKEGYLFGIARYMWFKKVREDRSRQNPDIGALEDVRMPEEELSPSSHKVLSFLTHAGQKCMEILKSFYYDKTPMKILSEQFGFTSERSATVQKYKCLEKVRDQVKTKRMIYEDFLE